MLHRALGPRVSAVPVLPESRMRGAREVALALAQDGARDRVGDTRAYAQPLHERRTQSRL